MKTKFIGGIIQISMPIALFFYFIHYTKFLELIRYKDISSIDIILHVLAFLLIMLFSIFLIILTYQGKSNSLCLLISMAETIVIYLLPFMHITSSDVFSYVIMNPIDFLHIYGQIIVLYSILLIINLIQHRKQKK